jgi:opacity protein-like surface antigen/outer membrane protease
VNRRIILAILCTAGSGGGALAADLDVLSPVPVQQSGPSRWDGLSIGFNGGGLLARRQSETQIWFPETFTTPGIPTSYKLSSDGGMVGVQAGFNKQWGSFVVGAVTDYDFVGGATGKQTTSGAITSGVNAGTPFSAAQSQQLQSLGTIRGRVGFAPVDDMLLYATAGLAFGQTRVSSNLSFPTLGSTFAGSHSDVTVGFAAGGGLEYALGPQWSVGAEFLYYDLADSHVVGLPNFIAPAGSGAPETDSNFAFRGYTLRLGLNYEFDGTNSASTSGLFQESASDITGEFGVRAGMSTGRARTTLYDGSGAVRLSQLTYQNTSAWTAEAYGRLDEPSSGLFGKGFFGIGKQTGGHLQDEDFPPAESPYSSTNSSQNDGRLTYADIDVGYYALQGSWYKFGGFAGYHYLDERFNAFGCTQTAGNAEVCPAGAVGSSNLGISDEGRWNSIRLGLAAQLTLPAGFSVRAEAAWLPYMSFNGGNDHWLREPQDFSGTIPESGSGSNGFQAEGELNYALSRNFDIGVGGRYWAMNAKGHMSFQNVSADGGSQVATFQTQRTQAFVQSAYHF